MSEGQRPARATKVFLDVAAGLAFPDRDACFDAVGLPVLARGDFVLDPSFAPIATVFCDLLVGRGDEDNLGSSAASPRLARVAPPSSSMRFPA